MENILLICLREWNLFCPVPGFFFLSRGLEVRLTAGAATALAAFFKEITQRQKRGQSHDPYRDHLILVHNKPRLSGLEPRDSSKLKEEQVASPILFN